MRALALLALLAATTAEAPRSVLIPSPAANRDNKVRAFADQSVPERFRGRTVLNKPKGFKEKVVALTFDDGPDSHNTPKVVGYLAKYNAKATFFVIGNYARRNGKLVRFIAEHGHVVGNHTWSHKARPERKNAGAEIWKTSRAIHRATGVWPSVFRPPYGIQDSWTAKFAKNERYGVIIWNRSGSDASSEATSETITLNAVRSRPGDIVLFHDGPGRTETVKALPGILKALSKKGYTFVTVPEMLRKWDAFLTAKGK